jgi:transcriptional regulator with XRE-family HTH domain
MLTRSEFVAWLRRRRSAGHSFTAIGRDFGVSRQAVQQWLSGATQPSRMALMLAEHLYRAPLELVPSLPLALGLPAPYRRRTAVRHSFPFDEL